MKYKVLYKQNMNKYIKKLPNPIIRIIGVLFSISLLTWGLPITIGVCLFTEETFPGVLIILLKTIRDMFTAEIV